MAMYDERENHGSLCRCGVHKGSTSGMVVNGSTVDIMVRQENVETFLFILTTANVLMILFDVVFWNTKKTCCTLCFVASWGKGSKVTLENIDQCKLLFVRAEGWKRPFFTFYCI